MEYIRWAVALIIISAPTIFGYSQPSHFTKNDHWKNERREIFFGGGATSFLGDVGGRDFKGKHFSPADLDVDAMRYAGHFGFRFRLHPNFALKTQLQYALFSGNDNLTHQAHRRHRNINFRTHVFEASQHFEFILARKEHWGSRHKIYGLKGHSHKSFQVYLFSGFSFFYYNPQGKGGPYGWTDLRPLNTEGQGLKNAPSSYDEYSYGIPFGIGYRAGLSPKWRISAELSWTHTFTDYLDDVSGFYYDNGAINEAYGAKAAFFADPSVKAFPDWVRAGEPRGNPNQNDVYSVINVSLIRNLSYKQTVRSKWKYKRRY